MSDATCTISGCDTSPTVARGWCRKHYGRWHRHGDPLRERPQRMCEVSDCDGRNFGNGLCEMHYARKRKHGSVDPRPDSRRVDRRVGADCRVCTGCNDALPFDNFHKDASRWDSLTQPCKACCKKARQAAETPEFVAARKARRKARRDSALELERAKRRAQYREDPVSARAQSQRRRALKRHPGAELFSDLEVFERDAWSCQLCDDAIDPELRWPHPMSASLDHVTPLTRGGSHTRANCQASHLRCNMRKGARLIA